jgi:hypothetical protein
MLAQVPGRSTLAEEVRRACIEAAVRAYDDAGVRGLCHDGRWECAIAAIRRLDLRPLAGAVDGEQQTR